MHFIQNLVFFIQDVLNYKKVIRYFSDLRQLIADWRGENV